MLPISFFSAAALLRLDFYIDLIFFGFGEIELKTSRR